MKTTLKIRMISIEAEGSPQAIKAALDSLAQVAGSLTSGIAENGCATKAKKRSKLQAPVSNPISTRGETVPLSEVRER